MKNKIKLFGLTLMALFLVLSILNYSGAGINDVKQSLKKGKVKTEDTKTNSTNIKTDPTQSKVKQNLKRIDLPSNYNGKKEDFFKNFYKPLKEIKIGVKQISIRSSSNKPNTNKTNSKVSGPQRIQDTVKKSNKGEAVFALPNPAQEFGFSETQEDKIRVQGEAEVTKLYEKAKSIVWGSAENPKILKEMHDLAYDVIFTKYSRYPDLCAISRLYLIDVTARFYLNPAYPLKEYSNGTFGGKDNNYYKRYLQIINDYIHEKKDANISKIFDIIAQQRMNIIWENDAGAATNITEDQAKIQTGLENLNEMINESAYYPDAEKAYIGAVVDEMSLILSYYRDMYYWSIMTGDYQTAHSIFNYGVENGKIKFTGTFMDVYSSIPKQVIFHYVSGYNEQGDPIIKDKMVDLYKEATQLLSMVELFRASETKVNEQEFDAKDKNLTQAKIEASCDWLSAFKPSPSDDENPPEVISDTELETVNNNAYGENNYYKNKPIIKRMYFTRDENIELTSEDIPRASDRITIRWEIDSAQPVGPSYDIKTTIHSNISNRYRQLTMKQDYEIHGYYEKFRPNETNNPLDKENLINNGKNALNKSIAYFSSDNDNVVPTMYDNPFFYNKLGFSNNDPQTFDPKKGIFKNSYGFLKSGGAEYITIEDKAYALIRNQANWFIVNSYSLPINYSGAIGEVNGPQLHPKSLFRSDGTSEYNENIDVLVLASGNCLNWIDPTISSNYFNFSYAWHKVLPGNDSIILGYKNTVSPELVRTALIKLDLRLAQSKPFTNNEIGTMWKEINNECSLIYHNTGDRHFLNMVDGFSYVYIIGRKYYFHGSIWGKNFAGKPVFNQLVNTFSN